MGQFVDKSKGPLEDALMSAIHRHMSKLNGEYFKIPLLEAKIIVDDFFSVLDELIIFEMMQNASHNKSLIDFSSLNKEIYSEKYISEMNLTILKTGEINGSNFSILYANKCNSVSKDNCDHLEEFTIQGEIMIQGEIFLCDVMTGAVLDRIPENTDAYRIASAKWLDQVDGNTSEASKKKNLVLNSGYPQVPTRASQKTGNNGFPRVVTFVFWKELFAPEPENQNNEVILNLLDVEFRNLFGNTLSENAENIFSFPGMCMRVPARDVSFPGLSELPVETANKRLRFLYGFQDFADSKTIGVTSVMNLAFRALMNLNVLDESMVRLDLENANWWLREHFLHVASNFPIDIFPRKEEIMSQEHNIEIIEANAIIVKRQRAFAILARQAAGIAKFASRRFVREFLRI